MGENGRLNSIPTESVNCIVCDARTVERFLHLGDTALANKFLTRDELSIPEPTYPLTVGFCHTCGHVQLTELVPRLQQRPRRG